MRPGDYPSYREVVVLAIGKLERSTGIDASAEATIDLLSRRSIWFLLGMLRWFRRPIVDVVVAAEGPRVVSTATILWLPQTAYVAGVATRPEWRGHGIASRILGDLAGRAHRRRRPWIALDVESENTAAISVYRKAGYHELGTFAWFTRLGPPPNPSPVPPEVGAVGRSGFAGLTSRLDASRPAEYRSAFPATDRVLTHNEHLVRGGRAQHRTWRKEVRGGGVAAVRAYHLPGSRMGAYFPLSTLPEPPAEEFEGPIDAATEWLRTLGPARLLAAAPEPRGGAAEALERRGFSAVVASTVMVRRTSA